MAPVTLFHQIRSGHHDIVIIVPDTQCLIYGAAERDETIARRQPGRGRVADQATAAKEIPAMPGADMGRRRPVFPAVRWIYFIAQG
jgi:hypothetical protein